ncbi:MAG: 2,3-bisphosphoglycerate-independent phosphoglycerate mutase [Bacteroidota bacterium]
MEAKKLILIILDGWGHGPDPKVSAIAQAQTPFIDSLYDKYPNAELITFGEDVGLPEGQMGNSEVGHLNIGAGRVVYQELARINKAIRERTLHSNPKLQEALQYAREQQKAVHLMGLVSDGGVHSHINHLMALCDIVEEQGIPQTFIHAFTDGRDCAPQSGVDFLGQLEAHIEGKPVEIASVIGRYYAMDRDKRWERVKKAYDLLVKGEGQPITDIGAAVRQSYAEGVTDEFLEPYCCVDVQGRPKATIKDGDLVLCFNFRTDRPREITEVLSQQDMPDYGMQKLDLKYLTMTRYDHTFKGVEVLFTKDDIQDTLGEVLSRLGKSQVRIAETEKYPHVTFFFSGGREAPFEGERRLMIPSPKVATYDLKPEMSAMEITDAITQDIRDNGPDFICLNYANTDMVGHTGVFSAAVKAAETVDQCMKTLVDCALEHDYAAIVIADHGNSDFMINSDGSPHTAHTVNPVPCFYLTQPPSAGGLQDGRLADVAPTILAIMGIEQPASMDGKILLTD